MKHAIFSYSVLILALFSCTAKFARHTSEPAVVVDNSPIKLRKLDKLFTTGDFNGDGRQDTLFQHTYSHLTHAEIDSAADPFQQPWDTVVYWFYDQQPDVYLSLADSDSLHLGAGQGLYCLINIGDNNADGRDEVALVIDRLDFSRVNSCRIYSLSKSGWVLLQQFEVHENAFGYVGEAPPVFGEIAGFLEKRDGKWLFFDYGDEWDRKPDDPELYPLTFGKRD